LTEPVRRSRKLLIAAAVLASSHARAAPPQDGLSDGDRELHAVLIAGMGTAYLVAEFPLGPTLSPAPCRWCEPPAFDAAVRDTLVWGDTELANTLSNLDGYALAPLAVTGLLLAGGWGNGWRRSFDDVAPMAEAAIAASLLQHATKFLVGRQRPYAHFAKPGTLKRSDEDNVSFFSGHTTLTFALAVSAGEVASERGYAIAPAVWATGLTLAATTGYLRIAADRHYATDVLTGAVVGSLVGWLWPRLVDTYLTQTSAATARSTPALFAVSGRF
jgi:membrane-associated phospholipid phosphatase